LVVRILAETKKAPASESGRYTRLVKDQKRRGNGAEELHSQDSVTERVKRAALHDTAFESMMATEITNAAAEAENPSRRGLVKKSSGVAHGRFAPLTERTSPSDGDE
jgi:hypothetical protein